MMEISSSFSCLSTTFSLQQRMWKEKAEFLEAKTRHFYRLTLGYVSEHLSIHSTETRLQETTTMLKQTSSYR